MKWFDRLRQEKSRTFVPTGTQIRRVAAGGATTWQKGQIILGEYTVEGILGAGGMGTVYLMVNSRLTGQRFAVKKTLFRDEEIRRNFLRELQLWLDLPENPHLAPCRFFRTVDDELAIFAEYVEGGALAKWITERRLTEPNRILDVAIQFAWGLHALHELGLVHQDVKPGNVLMTLDGVAKVSDFGLARARAAAGERAVPSGQDVLLSCGGMTEAYCSPEQAAFQSLTRKTDIWSWGVSVLEMFTGGVTWPSGMVADHALDTYVDSYGRAGVGADGLPLMPVEMVSVLRKCFRPDPRDRWETMLEIAEVLERHYRQYAGREYPRNAPAFVRASERKVFVNERRTAIGSRWGDPQDWLAAALKEDGRDPAQAPELTTPREGSRRAQAIADLAGYEEAQRIFEQLVAKERKDLLPELARLFANKAFIYEYLDDAPGALAAHDQALAIRERLVNHEGRHELANNLAMSYAHKGNALWKRGDLAGAAAAYDQALAIRERLVNKEGRRELANDLAATYVNKGSALRAQANLAGAVAAYDQALAIYELLVQKEGRRELASDLATTYMNKGTALSDQGDLAGAVAAYDQALAIYELLVQEEGRRELANDLAMTYMNKGTALSDQGDLARAVAAYDQALAIRERLVKEEGRRELANELAMTYVNKGNALSDQGDLAGAVAAYDQALAIYERLVREEGRRELTNNLARTYMNKGTALSDQGDLAGAVAAYDQALANQERLVKEEGRRELANDLAMSYMNKGNALWKQGDLAGAVAAYDQALAIRNRLVNHEGRLGLLGDLAWVRLLRANLVTDAHERASEARQAMSALEQEVRRTGRADLKRVLSWAASVFKEPSS